MRCWYEGCEDDACWYVRAHRGLHNSQDLAACGVHISLAISAQMDRGRSVVEVSKHDRRERAEGPPTGQRRDSAREFPAGASAGAARSRVGLWFQQPGHKWHYVVPGSRIATCRRAAGPMPGDDTVRAYLRTLDTTHTCVICLRRAQKDAQASESNG